MNTPRLLSIQVAEDKGLPMQPVEQATITETGIAGDRYQSGNGAFSKGRPTVRHISLIESEAIDAVRNDLKLDVTFADTRRNLLTIGIRLNELVGRKFTIGEVEVEGIELCDPCGRPGVLSGKADLRAGFKDAFEKRGGLRVKVLRTGDIHAGDPIISNEATSDETCVD